MYFLRLVSRRHGAAKPEKFVSKIRIGYPRKAKAVSTVGGILERLTNLGTTSPSVAFKHGSTTGTTASTTTPVATSSTSGTSAIDGGS
jgi:hypothetical protein